MPRPYSIDLRMRTIEAHKSGQKNQQIADRLSIGISTVVRYIGLYRKTGSVRPKKRTVYRKRILIDHIREIKSWIESCPHITIYEIQKRLSEQKSVKASTGAIFNFLKRENLSYKKNYTCGRAGQGGRETKKDPCFGG